MGPEVCSSLFDFSFKLYGNDTSRQNHAQNLSNKAVVLLAENCTQLAPSSVSCSSISLQKRHRQTMTDLNNCNMMTTQNGSIKKKKKKKRWNLRIDLLPSPPLHE